MAFGFGFNKAKVLASAEKNVKQGKLHNAIADYEKIVKEDPRDLNVINTIGDLNARVGNIEQATACFKRVGDAYASEGFTVKAIAMYKKLTKQNPTATDALSKLAELYTQQGLYNDARIQYTAVADQYLRSGHLDSACIVFQKMLELDPDNPHMQGRLAELYVRLGKKPEARDIYFRSAQSLRARGALDACDDALGHVLHLDPGFAQAVLLRGQVKLEADDPEGAVHCLEALPDIDSRAEGLRVLLRAQIKLENLAEAEPLARKLLTVFNDLSGISQYAEALMAANQAEPALRFYREHADRLLATNTTVVVKALHASIGRVKDSPRALEILCELFQRAGNTTHLSEVTELLAHAYVQEGALVKARDLYQKLADLEPENPLHGQNYKQIVAKLGEDSVSRQLTPELAGQAFMVEEVEHTAPALDQKYPADLHAAIQDALTEAELFASYNLPARAIPPLEAVLPRAPYDVQINQRLASLYARTSRYAEAAQCCKVLQSIFADAGHAQQAREYQEMQARYCNTAGIPVDSAAAADKATAAELVEPTSGAPDALIEPIASSASSSSQPALSEHPSLSSKPADGDVVAHEIDLSEEWDRVMSADQAAVAQPEPPSRLPEPVAKAEPERLYETAPDFHTSPAATPQETPAEPAVTSWEAELPHTAPVMDAAVGDLVEEVHFYISQGMWDEARAAFARAEALSPAAPALAELRALLTANSETTAPPPELELISDSAEDLSSSTEPKTVGDSHPAVSEFPVEHPPLECAPEPEPSSVLASVATIDLDLDIAAVRATQSAAADSSEKDGAPSEVAGVQGTAEPITAEWTTEAEVTPELPVVPEEEPPAVSEPIEAVASPAASSKLDATEVDATPVSAVSAEGPPREIPAAACASPDLLSLEDEPVTAEPDVLLENTLEDTIQDTIEDTPVASPVATIPATAANAAAANDDLLGGLVLELEDSLGDDFAVQPAPPMAAAAAASAASSTVIPAPSATSFGSQPIIELAPEPAEYNSDFALSDLFAEFKQDIESGAGEAEDPETHYNLGVAFKEMGLLDEAIAELQKVCQSVERGVAFTQVVEAYTWLADCFVQKGVPEAAIHWYEKALGIPGLGDDRSLAIHYELACANQQAGNLAAARGHFMHVLSVNIDYRDVAERIKALKS